jgi:hypothetical protein
MKRLVHSVILATLAFCVMLTAALMLESTTNLEGPYLIVMIGTAALLIPVFYLSHRWRSTRRKG